MSHQPGTIYRKQPTSTGQELVISTGCGITMQNIVLSTAAGTLKNCGVSILAPNAPSVFTLGQPYKGCQKEIITYSTQVIKIKTHSQGCKINGSTATKVFSIAATTKLNEQGVAIRLIGYSTMQWYGYVVNQSTVRTPVTLTSST